MRRIHHCALLLLFFGARARAADIASTLSAAATENRASLRAFATGGCGGLKPGAEGLRVLELKFKGGESARLLVVDVVRHGELLDVSFFTPGTAVLATRSLKVRPGADPVWMAADGKRFPVSDDLTTVPIESSAFSGIRARNESAPCYVARLAQDYVRPREMADAAAVSGAPDTSR